MKAIHVLSLMFALTAAVSAQQATAPPAGTNPALEPAAVMAAATAAAEAGGTGLYKATMLVEPSLPTHTVYRPRDLKKWGGPRRLPIIVWGNGACANYGNRFRYFLTEITSHGYFAVAIGPIGPQYLEGNASLLPPGAPAAPPGPVPREQPSRWQQLIEALDWAIAQDADRSSPYYHKLDTKKIAVMGQSCGGLQAIMASADPRVTTSVIWNSGTFPDGQPVLIGAEATRANLKGFHAPVAYISGDGSDIAYKNTEADYELINQVPIFRAYEKGMGHTATYRTAHGGAYSRVAVHWLDWQLKGDREAAAWFRGVDCRLCTNPMWVVRKKGID